MANLLKLLVSLGLDSSAYDKGLDEAEGKAKKTGGKIASGLSAIGGAVVTGGIVAAGAAIAGTTAFIASAIPAASDLNETVSKVGVVFGDNADKILKFGETAATSLGMSQNAALSAAGTYGNLFVSMGMTTDSAADMSTGLVGLAADLASFNNMAPEEVLEKLRAGLTGETEPLKALGVNLNAATVAAKAMEMGLAETSPDLSKMKSATDSLTKAQKNLHQVLNSAQPINDAQKTGLHDLRNAYADVQAAVLEAGAGSSEHLESLSALMAVSDKYSDVMGTGVKQAIGFVSTEMEGMSTAILGNVGELDAAAKAQATYALVMEQTATAQGDFARTSDGLANQQRIMAAQFEDLKATVGKAFLPVVVKLIGTFTKGMPAIVKAVQPLVDKIPGMLDKLLTAFTGVFGWLMDNKGVIVAALAIITAAVATWAYTTIAAAVPAMIAFMTASWPLIAVIAAIGAAAYLLYTAWTENWGGIQQIAAQAWAVIQPFLEQIWTWLQVNIPVALQWLSNAWQTVLLPAIMAVWAWVQANLLPLLGQLWTWLQTNIPVALQWLATAWTTVLWPAILAVWGWLSTVLFPLLMALGQFIAAVLSVAVTALAGIWQNVLWPALQQVWSFIQGNVLPIFEQMAGFISDTFGPVVQAIAGFVGGALVKAFYSLTNILKEVISWLEGVRRQLQSLKLPSWMTPGSPTPWEMGLRGVSEAMRSLTRTDLPKFQAELDLIPPEGVRASMALGGDNGRTVNDNRTFNIFSKEQPGEIRNGLTLSEMLGGPA